MFDPTILIQLVFKYLVLKGQVQTGFTQRNSLPLEVHESVDVFLSIFHEKIVPSSRCPEGWIIFHQIYSVPQGVMRCGYFSYNISS